ncbi:hypothetical protein DJ90_1565 [Paenibacillus macerans]|uniref:Uncharacterized protein n=1 Tax=Paenibacillus macerans TaxID=44252 RepID=A0A090ZAE2_PAEMA|nr:hypothetical protein DJ90_1565 [Paenibacillus macerans]
MFILDTRTIASRRQKIMFNSQKHANCNRLEMYFAGNKSAMKAFFKGYGLEGLKEKNIQI